MHKSFKEGKLSLQIPIPIPKTLLNIKPTPNFMYMNITSKSDIVQSSKVDMFAAPHNKSVSVLVS